MLPKPSWAEKLVRPILIYVALLLAFRFLSKRDMAQATLFDFLILLLISNVVQNAIIGEDNSVLGALAGAAALLLITRLLSRLTNQNRRARAFLEGCPSLLVKDGAPNKENMKRDGVSQSDLLTALRKQGTTRLEDVAYAILELDGSISVVKKDDDRRPHDCLPKEIVGSESDEDKA